MKVTLELSWILKESRVFFKIQNPFDISIPLEIYRVLKILSEKSNFSISEREAGTVLDSKAMSIPFGISSPF